MTTTESATVVHTETYLGREIKVIHAPHLAEGYSTRIAAYVVYVEGTTYYGGRIPTEHVVRDTSAWTYSPFTEAEEAVALKKAIKKGRSWVDADIADAEIRPSLELSIGYIPRSDSGAFIDQVGAKPTDFEVGDLVWFFSRGNIRQGRVEKVGKTNVNVAYVTEVGGIITRKSLKPEAIGCTIGRA